MPVFVMFMSSRSGIVFYSSAGAITDHSQSPKDIDPYFKSLLYMEDPGHLKPNGLSNPKSEHTTEILFRPFVAYEPTNSWSTVQNVTTQL